MDPSEATQVVIGRISNLVPEHFARKIIGFMLFQGLSDQELIRLALGPDTLIHNLVQKAANARLFASSRAVSPTINPTSSSDPSSMFIPFPSASSRPYPSQPAIRMVEPYWGTKLTVEQPTLQELMPYSEYIELEGPLDTVNPGPSNFSNDYYCPEAAFNNLSIRGGRNASNSMNRPAKICHYFSKGFCKHGSNCRYYHGDPSYPHSFGSNSYDVAGDDQGFSPRSFEKLEYEITELLKSRRGSPVSIASLPMLYYEKYGKTLQAEGYLTESQRHGKAGYSLTKLLARLKNSIRLIDRPHGQHALILAEDAAKYMDIRAERNDPGPIVSGSRQIYLTFPAESTFTEEDVSIYFSNFGPVQDVRIPCQPNRMFGFVTFVSADIAKFILSQGNPHFIAGARILAKPYREKARLVARNKFDHSLFFQSHPIDNDLELQVGGDSSRPFPRLLMEEHEHPIEHEAMRPAQLQLMADGDSSRQFPRQLMEEQEHPFELEAMHPAQLQLAGRPLNGQLKFPSNEQHFRYLIEVLNNGSTSDDNGRYPINNWGDYESSQGVDLPDNPFASVVASSISAVI